MQRIKHDFEYFEINIIFNERKEGNIMGLIKALTGAIGGTLADQWKEYFYCEALPVDVLVRKGTKRIGGKSSNKHGSDNVITDGSGIAVADGQCLIIVNNGQVTEICAEPGEYTFDSGESPSIFSGSFGESIGAVFKDMIGRFSYGGQAGKDQRVYYFNTKELTDNKFGTPNPIPFRVLDMNVGLDVDVSVRCSGVYSYKIENPILFYQNVCGNIADEFTRDEIDAQLKTEFISALQPAFGKLSEQGIRPSGLPAHAMELADLMDEVLSKKWKELRGLDIISVALNPITLSDEDAALIKNLQMTGAFRNPNMAAANLAQAQADAMRTAAGNSGGAMMGFMGMNMANQAGGLNANNLYQMGAMQGGGQYGQPMQGQYGQQMNGQPMQGQQGGAEGGEMQWFCPNCGNKNAGNFCVNCGSKRP